MFCRVCGCMYSYNGYEYSVHLLGQKKLIQLSAKVPAVELAENS